jgi:L-asparaginase II
VRAANRPLVAKGGAEGFYALAWRGASGRGYALAAKAAAGDARGRESAVTEALRQLRLLDASGVQQLAEFHTGPLRNHAGTLVGRLAPCLDLGDVRVD